MMALNAEGVFTVNVILEKPRVNKTREASTQCTSCREVAQRKFIEMLVLSKCARRDVFRRLDYPVFNGIIGIESTSLAGNNITEYHFKKKMTYGKSYAETGSHMTISISN